MIGDGVVIKNSFIGPYSSISDGCQIIGARIENTVLMRGARVESPPRPLDSCLVGEETLIKGNDGVAETIELFVGNQCTIKL